LSVSNIDRKGSCRRIIDAIKTMLTLTARINLSFDRYAFKTFRMKRSIPYGVDANSKTLRLGREVMTGSIGRTDYEREDYVRPAAVSRVRFRYGFLSYRISRVRDDFACPRRNRREKPYVENGRDNGVERRVKVRVGVLGIGPRFPSRRRKTHGSNGGRAFSVRVASTIQ